MALKEHGFSSTCNCCIFSINRVLRLASTYTPKKGQIDFGPWISTRQIFPQNHIKALRDCHPCNDTGKWSLTVDDPCHRVDMHTCINYTNNSRNCHTVLLRRRWSFHPVLIKFSTKPRGLQSPACPFRWLWLIYLMIDPRRNTRGDPPDGSAKVDLPGPVWKRDEKCTIDTVCGPSLRTGQKEKRT